MDITKIEVFKKMIREFYLQHRRSFLWREDITPYNVLVSEIMLQQTQTDRVAKKFPEFIQRFPTYASLAESPFSDVLAVWKGLGYNRRALSLQKIAQRVVCEFECELPQDPEVLQTFPGIGPNTAGSIVAFAFNKPVVFIETNIRTVFIHHFFQQESLIHDKQLLPLIKETLDNESPRDWYYALMDYGVKLKKEIGNASRKSAHYTKQSAFCGSDRQLRGQVLQILIEHPGASLQDMISQLGHNVDRITKILNDLCKEQFIEFCSDGWSLVQSVK